MKKVCVFAASSPGIDQSYFDAGREMARILAKNNIAMNYGAGSVGIMGAMADEMIQQNGEVTGIIPEFMTKMGWTHPHLKEIEVVASMQERKLLMMKEVDAIISMPGGSGNA